MSANKVYHNVNIDLTIEQIAKWQKAHVDIADYLTYEADTGILRWKCDIGGKHGNKFKAGSAAGTSKPGEYSHVRVNKRLYKAHRVAWYLHYGEWPKGEIDHINHDRSDNRIENLREVSRAENNRNMPLQKNNKSGYTNVYFAKWANKYRAGIKINGKKIHLGYFSNADDANDAVQAAKSRFGFHDNHGG